MRALRYRFWLAMHDGLERAWHWVYRVKVRPLAPALPTRGPLVYSKILENDEVTIYRTGAGIGND